MTSPNTVPKFRTSAGLFALWVEAGRCHLRVYLCPDTESPPQKALLGGQLVRELLIVANIITSPSHLHPCAPLFSDLGKNDPTSVSGFSKFSKEKSPSY